MRRESDQEMRGRWHDIDDARVLAAFERVDRTQFIPPRFRRYAHRDAPLPIGFEQTISQPYVVAVMTQALALSPGERVLEIGTGSGFQTAILCELTDLEAQPRGSSVYSIERYRELAERAEARLNAMGYFPHIAWGDGALGWPTPQVFDAVLVTAAPPALPLPLWLQLREGGRMVIPVGKGDDQQLWLLSRSGRRILRRALGPVRFVPLVSPIFQDRDKFIDLETD